MYTAINSIIGITATILYAVIDNGTVDDIYTATLPGVIGITVIRRRLNINCASSRRSILSPINR